MRLTFKFETTSAESGAWRRFLVRNLVFTRVYYNNGNSLPLFSIPTIWGKIDEVVRPAKGSCVLSHLSKSANWAIDNVFVRDVRAPYLRNAGLLHTRAGHRPVRGTIAIHSCLASTRSLSGRARGKRSRCYLPIEG